MTALALPPSAITTAISQPGIYPDVPAEVYHRLPYASNSLLGHLKRSPLHCRHAMDNPTEPTPAMLLGTAAHLAILEPDLFEQRYTVAGQCSATVKKTGERCGHGGKFFVDGEWFCGTHWKEGELNVRHVLSQADYETCLRMREAAWAHPRIRLLLKRKTSIETVVIWDDPDTGVRCKLRSDLVSFACNVVADLKTTTDASREAFSRSIYTYEYYRQSAMYLAGWAAHGHIFDGFTLLPIEKEAPYCAAAYVVKDKVLAEGHNEMLTLLERWRTCQESGKWPGYSDNFEEISLPPYAWKQLSGEQQE